MQPYGTLQFTGFFSCLQLFYFAIWIDIELSAYPGSGIHPFLLILLFL